MLPYLFASITAHFWMVLFKQMEASVATDSFEIRIHNYRIGLKRKEIHLDRNQFDIMDYFSDTFPEPTVSPALINLVLFINLPFIGSFSIETGNDLSDSMIRSSNREEDEEPILDI